MRVGKNIQHKDDRMNSLYMIFVMKYFYKFLKILLGIVVSALAFHAGGPG